MAEYTYTVPVSSRLSRESVRLIVLVGRTSLAERVPFAFSGSVHVEGSVSKPIVWVSGCKLLLVAVS